MQWRLGAARRIQALIFLLGHRLDASRHFFANLLVILHHVCFQGKGFALDPNNGLQTFSKPFLLALSRQASYTQTRIALANAEYHQYLQQRKAQAIFNLPLHHCSLPLFKANLLIFSPSAAIFSGKAELDEKNKTERRLRKIPVFKFLPRLKVVINPIGNSLSQIQICLCNSKIYHSTLNNKPDKMSQQQVIHGLHNVLSMNRILIMYQIH